MSANIFPTSLYMEETPNPTTMKFVANRRLIPGKATAEFIDIKQTKGSSLLAEQLFSFPFVTGVFVANNFVTVTKNHSIGWDFVGVELREFIREHLLRNEFAVQKMPLPLERPKKKEEVPAEPVKPTAFDGKIKQLLEEYIRPAVESDGGAIDFRSYKDGVVTVQLRGSCSGCPSAQVTVKNGIEQLLKSKMAGIKEVIAEEL